MEYITGIEKNKKIDDKFLDQFEHAKKLKEPLVSTCIMCNSGCNMAWKEEVNEE